MATSQSMRVLFISHDSYLHGATRSLIDIADLLRRKGIDTHVLIPKGGPAEELLESREISYEKIFYAQLVNYGQPDSFPRQMRKLLSALRHLPALVKAVKKANADIIYVNTLTNYWLLLLRLFVKMPLVFHIREFGRPDHQVHLLMGGIIFNILKGLPSLIICNSRAVSAYMKNHFGIRGLVLYNGVLVRDAFTGNLERRRLHDAQENSSGVINFGIVGNISEGKGQLEVVRSFHKALLRNPKLHLYIIGGGKQEIIDRYVKEYSLEDSITVTGFLNDITGCYTKCDIVIVNSKMEAFGRVTVEAASFGIPVIGRNTGAIPEIIVNRKTGLLYDGSEDDLLEKIEELVADAGLRNTLGRNAWALARELYSLESHIEKIEELFRDLLEGKHFRKSASRFS